MTKKQLFGKLLILCVSFIIAAGIAESAIRLLFPVYDPRGYVKFTIDRAGLCLAQKNFKGRLWINTREYNVAVAINKYGFRDTKDIARSQYADIFVVGDSFSFGYGVEENERYSDIVADLTGREVYNICAPGDIEQYIKLLDYAQDNGAKISNVIMGICMENDLREYDKPAARDPFLAVTKRFLVARSALARFIAAQLSANDTVRSLAEKFKLLYVQYANLPVPDYSQAAIDQSAKKIISLSRRYGLVVCIIPSRALWVGPEKNRGEQSAIHGAFVNELRKNGVFVVDMREAFERPPGAPLDYHFEYDGHWNAKGHRAAARALYENMAAGPINF